MWYRNGLLIRELTAGCLSVIHCIMRDINSMQALVNVTDSTRLETPPWRVTAHNDTLFHVHSSPQVFDTQIGACWFGDVAYMSPIKLQSCMLSPSVIHPRTQHRFTVNWAVTLDTRAIYWRAHCLCACVWLYHCQSRRDTSSVARRWRDR